MTPEHFREVVWKPTLERVGVEYRPPIQTRHTFVTVMLNSDVEVGWIQKMMGHSSLQMLFQRYYRYIDRRTGPNHNMWDKVQ